MLWWLYLVARFFRLRAPVAALGFGFGAALVIGYSAFNYLTLPPLIGPATSLFDQPLDVLGVAAGFLLVGLGPWPTYENPFSILAPIVGVPVVLAYVFGSLALARRIWRERAADPGRVALALVILGTLILAFAAGRSRPAAIIDRYAVVSACGLAALYLSRVRPAEASSSRKSMAIWGAAAALVAGGLYLVNREPGIHGAYRLRDSSHGVAEDIEAREAPILIMGRHSGNISMMSADRDFGLLRLRDAGIPPFDKLPDDPVFRPQPIGEIPPSVTWRCTEAEYAEQRNLPRLDLPRPPPGTLALRLAADTKRWGVGRKFYCNGSTARPGRPIRTWPIRPTSRPPSI